MKWMLSLGLSFLCIMAACNSKKQVPDPVEGPSSELSAIDSLMWSQPDSALLRLLPWFDTCCRDAARHVSTATAYNRHYANLLLSELLYKNDYPQTNRTELQQALAYLDSLTMLADTHGVSLQPRPCRDARRAFAQNIAFLDARAHYINGVGYYENDSMVPSCKEYMKALEVMEERFEEKELVGHKARFMALTYTRLSSLFSDMYLHEQAIYFAQLSLASNQKLDVPDWHIARMLCEIGIQYNLLEQLDSAGCYYESAAKVLNDTNCLLYRDITTQQTLLSYKKSGIGKNTLIRLHYLINQANSEAEYLLRCFNIGGVFCQEKQLDSAWYYLNKVYNNTQRIALKKQAAEWLVEICRTQGRDDEILEYAGYLVPFANQEENQSEIKSQLTELYNSYRQATLSRQHQQVLKKNITISLMVFAGLIAGLIAYIILYHNNRRQKQHLEKQIKEEQLLHDMKQKAMSGRLKQSNQKLKDILKRIENPEAEHKPAENRTSYITFDERYKAFWQSPICLEILDIAKHLHSDNRNKPKTSADITEYKAFALSLLQITQLTNTVETYFPYLYTTLKAQYTSLNKKEWLHCCLYLLQLDKMSICVLLQEPYYTCRRYTLKLEEAFGCQQGLTAFLIEQSKVH